MPLLPALAAYLDARAAEAADLDPARRARLDDLAEALLAARGSDGRARALFVCTHNSRRSQLAQLLAWAAGRRAGVALECRSAGTEATAFHPNAVAAARRAGFAIEAGDGSANPRRAVRCDDGGPGVVTLSQTLAEALPPDPDGPGWVAVMVCDEADAACPLVPGAVARVSLPYRDPKEADGTPEQDATYDARCAQLARELLYVVGRVAAGGAAPAAP